MRLSDSFLVTNQHPLASHNSLFDYPHFNTPPYPSFYFLSDASSVFLVAIIYSCLLCTVLIGNHISVIQPCAAVSWLTPVRPTSQSMSVCSGRHWRSWRLKSARSSSPTGTTTTLEDSMEYAHSIPVSDTWLHSDLPVHVHIYMYASLSCYLGAHCCHYCEEEGLVALHIILYEVNASLCSHMPQLSAAAILSLIPPLPCIS